MIKHYEITLTIWIFNKFILTVFHKVPIPSQSKEDGASNKVANGAKTETKDLPMNSPSANNQDASAKEKGIIVKSSLFSIYKYWDVINGH